MKKPQLFVLLLVVLGFASLQAGAQQTPEQNHGFTNTQKSVKEWWNMPYPTRFDRTKLSLAQKQGFLTVKGNKVLDEAGKPFILRGVNIADPDKLVHQNVWSEKLFAEVKKWGANSVRLPIHPIVWRNRGPQWVLERIDEAVIWANAHDQYLIVDWHSIGNLKTGMYQMPFYETSPEETANFWRAIAYRYKDVPTVAVYEIFNEPTHNFIGTGDYSLGKITWDEWRVMLEDLIDLIYVYNPKAIPLVGGFNWSYDLTPVASKPVRREGIAYSIHPYPTKAKPKVKDTKGYFELWEKQWGYVAAKYPVMATELGWVKPDGFGAHVPVIDDGAYGPRIVEFMEARGIHWTVWTFDPDWAPVMISDWNFTPTEQGAFFRDEMLKRNGKLN